MIFTARLHRRSRIVACSRFAIGTTRCRSWGSAAGQDDGAPHVIGSSKRRFVRSIRRSVASTRKSTISIGHYAKDVLEIASGSVEALWRAHREPARVDAARPLVSIAQAHRSGGTRRRGCLMDIRRCSASPQELAWRGEVRESKYRWPDIDPSTEGPLRIAKRLIERILDDARHFNLFGYEKAASPNWRSASSVPVVAWVADVETFLDVWQAKPPQNRRERLDIFMTAYFSAFLDWRGSVRPEDHHGAQDADELRSVLSGENEAFFNDYPDGLMISICRHPADWYASATRAGEKYDGPGRRHGGVARIGRGRPAIEGAPSKPRGACCFRSPGLRIRRRP